MIKLKYNDINNTEFMEGMRTLVRVSLPVKSAYTASKVFSRVEKELKTAGDLYAKVLKEHCELDEKGELKAQMMKQDDKEIPIPNSFIVKAGSEPALEKALEAFFNLEFEVPFDKIPLSDLEKACQDPNGIKAKHLVKLEAIVNPLEAAVGSQ
jgi:hypothetical protein